VLIKAAKYLGVAPWELLRQPDCWQHWALGAMDAEATAAEELKRFEADDDDDDEG